MRVKLIIILVFIGSGLFAQTFDPGNFFTSSMLNYNPAVAGYNEAFTVLLNHQSKWLGFEGAPENTSLACHTPVLKYNLAFGVNVDRYTKGNQNYLGAGGNIAFHIPMKTVTLSMGLKAGLVSYNENELYLGDGKSDPLFTEYISEIIPNFGVGILLKSPKYFFGISIPYLLGYDFTSRTTTVNMSDFTFHITGGYTFYLTPEIKYHPAILLKHRSTVATQLNLNLINLTVFDKYMLGFNYIKTSNYNKAKNNGFSTLINVKANPQTNIGLAYQIDYGALSSNSLELFVQYTFSYEINASSPRNF